MCHLVWHRHAHKPSSVRRIENLQDPQTHLIPIKRVVYSFLRQDVPGRQPKGIITRWKVQCTEIGFQRERGRLISFDPWITPSSSGRKMEELWSLGKSWKEAVKGRDNWLYQWKKNFNREAEGNRVREIRLSELQHGRMWHAESRKRKLDRYRLIWLPLLKNVSIPFRASVAVNVLIKACTFGLFLTSVWGCYTQLAGRKYEWTFSLEINRVIPKGHIPDQWLWL